MKYPKSIQAHLNAIEEITAIWVVPISMDDILKWVLQFEVGDYDLALRVVRNLNVIGQKDLNDALFVANSKLQRRALEKGVPINSKNTLFAGLGSAGKSGSMIGYHFRVLNGISEENFLSDDTVKFIEDGRIKNLVLVDDVVSTGNQAIKEITKITETVTALGVENIFLLTVCGLTSGLNKISEETKAYTFSTVEYGAEDTVVSLDGTFYDGVPHEQRGLLRSRLQYYGGALWKKFPFGYGGTGALIVFHYNTPNSTLPIVWSDANGWIPLFPRARKIPGIVSYYNELDQSRDKQVKAKRPVGKSSEAKVLSLFVEGKAEEVFFDMVRPRLCEDLGYSDIRVIALGGAMQSFRLMEDLKHTHNASLFVLDEDLQRRFLEPTSPQPVVFLKPSIAAFFDLKRLGADGVVLELPPELVESDAPMHEIERRLFKLSGRTGRHLALRMSQLVQSYLREDKLHELIDEMKRVLKAAQEGEMPS